MASRETVVFCSWRSFSRCRPELHQFHASASQGRPAARNCLSGSGSGRGRRVGKWRQHARRLMRRRRDAIGQCFGRPFAAQPRAVAGRHAMPARGANSPPAATVRAPAPFVRQAQAAEAGAPARDSARLAPSMRAASARARLRRSTVALRERRPGAGESTARARADSPHTGPRPAPDDHRCTRLDFSRRSISRDRELTLRSGCQSPFPVVERRACRAQREERRRSCRFTSAAGTGSPRWRARVGREEVCSGTARGRTRPPLRVAMLSATSRGSIPRRARAPRRAAATTMRRRAARSISGRPPHRREVEHRGSDVVGGRDVRHVLAKRGLQPAACAAAGGGEDERRKGKCEASL